MIFLSKTECAFKNRAEQFFSPDFSQKAQLVANKPCGGLWERFTILRLPNNNVAFRGYNNKFLSVKKDSLSLFVNADSIGTNESFELLIKK